MKETLKSYKDCMSILLDLYENNKIGAEAYVKLDAALKDMYSAGYRQGTEDTEKFSIFRCK